MSTICETTQQWRGHRTGEGEDIVKRYGHSSVSNGPKLAIQFQLWVGTELKLLHQIFPHQKTEPHQTLSFLAGSTILQTQIFGSN
jgi:hypothetical protein